MATDNTDVPVGNVIGIGLLSIAIVVGVHVGIWDYYYSMYGAEQQRKVLGVPSNVLDHERTEEAARLGGIDRAMREVASSVGTEQRPTSITPRASTDMQPLQGWQQRPRVVPNPPPAQGDLPAGAQAPSAQPPGAQPTPSAAVAPTAPPAAGAPPANAPAAPVAPAAHAPVAPAAHPAAPTTQAVQH